MNSLDIIKIIEEFAPKDLAIEGDNIGLQVAYKNNLTKKVNNIGIALDPSLEVIKKAKENNVDFLFTHHPILKDPIKTFTGTIYEKLKILTNNNITLYSAHTNLDICKNGLNDALVKLYNLKEVENLYSNGLGRIGLFNGSFLELLNITKKYICENPIIVDNPNIYKKNKLVVGVLSGYGLSQKTINYIINHNRNIDLYISGDLTHHSKIIAEENNLAIIDGTHYGTEVYGLKDFKKYIENNVENNINVISLDF